MPTRPTMPARNATDSLSFGEWGIRFNIKTGGQSYECVLQERATYERQKATRNGSVSSVSSVSSTASDKSTS